jgi:hypothetical protein
MIDCDCRSCSSSRSGVEIYAVGLHAVGLHMVRLHVGSRRVDLYCYPTGFR